VADNVIRVLLVDDHQVVRRGLRTFLEVQGDIEVVGEAGDGDEGVARAMELRPDVILMDVKMPGTDGIEALRQLRAAENPARVLIVTSFTEQRTVVPALRAGAAGYVYKDVDPVALADAIRSVHAGHVLLQPEVAGALLSQEHPVGTGRAGALGEDREDPRVEHPHEARPRRPYAGGAVGGAQRGRQLTPRAPGASRTEIHTVGCMSPCTRIQNGGDPFCMACRGELPRCVPQGGSPK